MMVDVYPDLWNFGGEETQGHFPCAHRKGAITASRADGRGMTSACEASSGDMTRRIPEPNNPPFLPPQRMLLGGYS